MANINPMTLADNTAILLNPELRITPLLVPHRNEYSETYGFIIHGPRRMLPFIPDIDRWEAWNRSLLSFVNSVNYCLLCS